MPRRCVAGNCSNTRQPADMLVSSSDDNDSADELSSDILKDNVEENDENVQNKSLDSAAA